MFSCFAVFEDLEISADHYLMNVANHRNFARQMEIRDYFQPPKRGAWNDFSQMANIATVNAYYNQATNTMVVPIGMLQPPLFWSRPKSLTFGAFGIVVGKQRSLLEWLKSMKCKRLSSLIDIYITV